MTKNSFKIGHDHFDSFQQQPSGCTRSSARLPANGLDAVNRKTGLPKTPHATGLCHPINPPYSTKDLQETVISAVRKFIKQDCLLLQLEAHEQAISHRNAVYLEPFSDSLEAKSERAYLAAYADDAEKTREYLAQTDGQADLAVWYTKDEYVRVADWAYSH